MKLSGRCNDPLCVTCGNVTWIDTAWDAESDRYLSSIPSDTSLQEGSVTWQMLRLIRDRPGELRPKDFRKLCDFNLQVVSTNLNRLREWGLIAPADSTTGWRLFPIGEFDGVT